MKVALLVICFCFITVNLICENQDVINLKDGTILKGEILESTDDYVTIKTSLGEIKIDRININISPVTIYLKDENIIKGNLINKNDISVMVETSLGSFEIKVENIKKIVEDTNFVTNQETKLKTNSQNENEDGIKTIANALLYQQRQKKISTALGFQALGAGLLYAEDYTKGTLMLVAENGLIISGAFIDDPEIASYLWISGLILKGINTFFTIKEINEYNENLLHDLNNSIGLNKGKIIFKEDKGNFYFAISTGFQFDNYGTLVSGGSIGFSKQGFGRIDSNFSIDSFSGDAIGIINLVIKYNYFLNLSRKINFIPSCGLGYISAAELLKEETGDFVTTYGGLGLIFGSSLEFQLSKRISLGLEYNYNLGVGETRSTNSTLLFKLGFLM